MPNSFHDPIRTLLLLRQLGPTICLSNGLPLSTNEVLFSMHTETIDVDKPNGIRFKQPPVLLFTHTTPFTLSNIQHPGNPTNQITAVCPSNRCAAVWVRVLISRPSSRRSRTSSPTLWFLFQSTTFRPLLLIRLPAGNACQLYRFTETPTAAGAQHCLRGLGAGEPHPAPRREQEEPVPTAPRPDFDTTPLTLQRPDLNHSLKRHRKPALLERCSSSRNARTTDTDQSHCQVLLRCTSEHIRKICQVPLTRPTRYAVLLSSRVTCVQALNQLVHHASLVRSELGAQICEPLIRQRMYSKLQTHALTSHTRSFILYH